MNLPAVKVGSGALAELPAVLDFSKYSRVAFVFDDNIAATARRVSALLPKAACTLGFSITESSKSPAGAEQCWKFFIESNLDRSSVVIVLGGGALCDLVGFAASTYQRGVSTVLIPSTLLAQADAAFGGKTALNFAGIKNCLGTFHQPSAVLCDLDLLSSLPARELASGFSEILKIAVMRDAKLFSMLESQRDIASVLREGALQRAIQLKLDIVDADVSEAGLRKFLNFGHTFGHAVEALAVEEGRSLPHGEAVALGMAAEAWIAHQLGLISSAELERLEKVIRAYNLRPAFELNWGLERILQKMQHDKKRRGAVIDWALPSGIGAGVLRSDVSLELVKAAYAALQVNFA